eukprot:s1287_g21.t1
MGVATLPVQGFQTTKPNHQPRLFEYLKGLQLWKTSVDATAKCVNTQIQLLRSPLIAAVTIQVTIQLGRYQQAIHELGYSY